MKKTLALLAALALAAAPSNGAILQGLENAYQINDIDARTNWTTNAAGIWFVGQPLPLGTQQWASLSLVISNFNEAGAFGLALWGAGTTNDAVTALGLGSMSLQDSNAVNITGGRITGLSADLAVADGGSGASTPAGARANFGLGSMSLQDSNAVYIIGGSASNMQLGSFYLVVATTQSVGSLAFLSASGDTLGADAVTADYFIGGTFSGDGSGLTGIQLNMGSLFASVEDPYTPGIPGGSPAPLPSITSVASDLLTPPLKLTTPSPGATYFTQIVCSAVRDPAGQLVLKNAAQTNYLTGVVVAGTNATVNLSWKADSVAPVNGYVILLQAPLQPDWIVEAPDSVTAVNFTNKGQAVHTADDIQVLPYPTLLTNRLEGHFALANDLDGNDQDIGNLSSLRASNAFLHGALSMAAGARVEGDIRMRDPYRPSQGADFTVARDWNNPFAIVLVTNANGASFALMSASNSGAVTFPAGMFLEGGTYRSESSVLNVAAADARYLQQGSNTAELAWAMVLNGSNQAGVANLMITNNGRNWGDSFPIILVNPQIDASSPSPASDLGIAFKAYSGSAKLWQYLFGVDMSLLGHDSVQLVRHTTNGVVVGGGNTPIMTWRADGLVDAPDATYTNGSSLLNADAMDLRYERVGEDKSWTVDLLITRTNASILLNSLGWNVSGYSDGGGGFRSALLYEDSGLKTSVVWSAGAGQFGLSNSRSYSIAVLEAAGAAQSNNVFILDTNGTVSIPGASYVDSNSVLRAGASDARYLLRSETANRGQIYTTVPNYVHIFPNTEYTSLMPVGSMATNDLVPARGVLCTDTGLILQADGVYDTWCSGTISMTNLPGTVRHMSLIVCTNGGWSAPLPELQTTVTLFTNLAIGGGAGAGGMYATIAIRGMAYFESNTFLDVRGMAPAFVTGHVEHLVFGVRRVDD